MREDGKTAHSQDKGVGEVVVPRPGSVRYFDDTTNEWRMANPRSPLFSTITMLATEYFDGERWVSINDDDDDNGGTGGNEESPR